MKNIKFSGYKKHTLQKRCSTFIHDRARLEVSICWFMLIFVKPSVMDLTFCAKLFSRDYFRFLLGWERKNLNMWRWESEKHFIKSLILRIFWSEKSIWRLCAQMVGWCKSMKCVLTQTYLIKCLRWKSEESSTKECTNLITAKLNYSYSFIKS